MKDELSKVHLSERRHLLLRRVLTAVDPRRELLSLVQSVGNPLSGFRSREPVETLRVTKPDDAHPRSQSRIFGTGEFPLHSDGAHWAIPPRYVALGCIQPGACPTYVLPWSRIDIEVSLVRDAVFLLKAGRRAFYAHLKEGEFYRYDSCAMVPANRTAQTLCERLRAGKLKAKADLIEWQAGDVLLLDNWNALHGRGAASSVQPAPRELVRVAFGDGQK